MVNVSYLDTPGAAADSDGSNLAELLKSFPRQLAVASDEFARLELPATLAACREVVFCGMGGSAIGGDIACDLPAKLVRKPLHVVREYNLPAFVGKDSLVVVVTYSGETEEALSCFHEAKERGAALVVITSGERLASEAAAADATVYRFDFQAPPRDALGYLLGPLPRVLVAAGALELKEADLAPAISGLGTLLQRLSPTVPTKENRAKELAYLLYDHVPVVIGSGTLRGVARRWKSQLNEHAKSASYFDVLPEADHNTVEGFQFPVRFRDDAVVIILRSNYDHPEVAKRAQLLGKFLDSQHVAWHEPKLNLPQQDLWGEKLSLVMLGDWVSYYLALLYRTDPTPVPAITSLKAQLRG